MQNPTKQLLLQLPGILCFFVCFRPDIYDPPCSDMQILFFTQELPSDFCLVGQVCKYVRSTYVGDFSPPSNCVFAF